MSPTDNNEGGEWYMLERVIREIVRHKLGWKQAETARIGIMRFVDRDTMRALQDELAALAAEGKLHYEFFPLCKTVNCDTERRVHHCHVFIGSTTVARLIVGEWIVCQKGDCTLEEVEVIILPR